MHLIAVKLPRFILHVLGLTALILKRVNMVKGDINMINVLTMINVSIFTISNEVI